MEKLGNNFENKNPVLFFTNIFHSILDLIIGLKMNATKSQVVTLLDYLSYLAKVIKWTFSSAKFAVP